MKFVFHKENFLEVPTNVVTQTWTHEEITFWVSLLQLCFLYISPSTWEAKLSPELEPLGWHKLSLENQMSFHDTQYSWGPSSFKRSEENSPRASLGFPLLICWGWILCGLLRRQQGTQKWSKIDYTCFWGWWGRRCDVIPGSNIIKINLNYTRKFSSYLTENTLRIRSV
jgi:hypothetical protein